MSGKTTNTGADSSSKKDKSDSGAVAGDKNASKGGNDVNGAKLPQTGGSAVSNILIISGVLMMIIGIYLTVTEKKKKK